MRLIGRKCFGFLKFINGVAAIFFAQESIGVVLGILLHSTVARSEEKLLHEASQNEVDSHMRPEQNVGFLELLKGGATGLHHDVGVACPCAGDCIAYHCPEWAHGMSGPRYAGEEHENQRSEDDGDENAFSVVDKDRDGLSH